MRLNSDSVHCAMMERLTLALRDHLNKKACKNDLSVNIKILISAVSDICYRILKVQ